MPMFEPNDPYKKFIFKILKYQIENRRTNSNPYDNQFENAAELFWDSICYDGIMHINKVKFPDIRWFHIGSRPGLNDIYLSWYKWPILYADSLMIHHLFDDDYNEFNHWFLEDWGLEGPYGFNDIVVEKGDTVIDAGAYIGDWSAVASVMGGNVYAFEPNPDTQSILTECAKLNNFNIIKKGLGNVNAIKQINVNSPQGSQHITDSPQVADYKSSSNDPFCEVVTLDSFTKENNIHVDFLKSDIEGYERYMLEGAKRVLTEDEPKLAIRVYHNHYADAWMLPEMLMKINPNYKIFVRKNTMYARVD